MRYPQSSMNSKPKIDFRVRAELKEKLLKEARKSKTTLTQIILRYLDIGMKTE